jgi:hypothetical protein
LSTRSSATVRSQSIKANSSSHIHTTNLTKAFLQKLQS